MVSFNPFQTATYFLVSKNIIVTLQFILANHRTWTRKIFIGQYCIFQFSCKKLLSTKCRNGIALLYRAHWEILPSASLIISTGASSVSKRKVPNPKKHVIDRFKSFQFSILRPLSSLTSQYSPLPIQLDQKSLQRSIHPSSSSRLIRISHFLERITTFLNQNQPRS